jgi:hypothetical protein
MVARLRGPSGIGASAQAAPATTPLASCHPDPGKESVTGGASCMVEDHQPRLLRVGQLPGQPMTVPAMGEGASSCAPLTSRNPGAAAGRGALLPADAAATHSASGIRPWLPRLARQCSIRPRNSLNSFVPSNVRPMHPPASHSTGPRTVRTVFTSDHARLPEGHAPPRASGRGWGCSDLGSRAARNGSSPERALRQSKKRRPQRSRSSLLTSPGLYSPVNSKRQGSRTRASSR